MLRSKYGVGVLRRSISNQQSRERLGSLSNLVEQKRISQREGRKRLEQLRELAEIKAVMKKYWLKLDLYMTHNCLDCLQLYNLLNFYEIGFHKISDPAQLKDYSKSFGVNYKTQKYPVLRVKLDHEPTRILNGSHKILDFLRENSLLTAQLKEDTQSSILIDFINSSLLPHLEIVFWHPLSTARSIWHFHIRSYTAGVVNYNILTCLYLNFKAISSAVLKNLGKILFNRKKYLQAFKLLNAAFSELNFLLEKSSFLGGDSVSKADIYLLSIFQSKSGEIHLFKYLKNHYPHLHQWIERMNITVYYDPKRETFL